MIQSSELKLDLVAIRARVNNVPPGPWYAGKAYGSTHHFVGEGGRAFYETPSWSFSTKEGSSGWETDGGYEGYGVPEAVAKFCAHARTDIPALLDEVERLRTTIIKLYEHVDMRKWFADDSI